MKITFPDIDQITQDISRSSDELVRALADFPTYKFNKKPTANTWSAGDVAEHLVILENLVNKVLKGRTRSSSRNPDQKIEFIRSTLLDLNKKLNAAALIAPTGHSKEKEDIIQKVKKNRQHLNEILRSTDPSMICIDFAHGIFGELTRVEWTYYNIYHSKRHINQLKNIEKKIKIL